VLRLKTDPTTKVATQSILPFTGLNNPTGVALDGQGNLYVVDSGNNRVLKLAKAFAAQ
jgi:DNA-binding beta-propeller fold protein YncE